MARIMKVYPVLAFLLLCICAGDVSSLSVTVNDIECVYEYVLYEGDTISGNFVVVDHDIFWNSDHPGVDFTVTSPGGNTVHQMKRTSGDKFEFKAPRSGMYKFCFHNLFSTPEAVSFYIHVGHIPSEHNLAKDEHLDPINVKISELREALESVTSEQKYLKARDARHRHIMALPWRPVAQDYAYRLLDLGGLIMASGITDTTAHSVSVRPRRLIGLKPQNQPTAEAPSFKLAAKPRSNAINQAGEPSSMTKFRSHLLIPQSPFLPTCSQQMRAHVNA